MTGSVPFQTSNSATPAERKRFVEINQPLPLAKSITTSSLHLQNLIGRSLLPDKASRYQSALEMLDAIDKLKIARVQTDSLVASDDSKHFVERITLRVVQRSWPRILKLVKQKSPVGVGFLEKAEVIALEDSVIILSFSDYLALERIQKRGKEFVEKTINQGINTKGLTIKCIPNTSMSHIVSALDSVLDTLEMNWEERL